MAGNLTRDEARERGRLLTVSAYDIELDLTTGAERFGSTTTVRFRCADPGAATFCELADADVREATLNGVPVAYDAPAGRLILTGLAAENELRVVADGTYSRTGQGLHRFTDPEDGAVYLYSQAATADAQRVFACFDQPDLKAPFTFTVTAPSDWHVVGNQAESAVAPAGRGARRWNFPPTPPLPTYLAVVVAGPYHQVAGEYQGPDGQRIPLRVCCRASLAAHLDAEELFDVTRRGLDFYQRAFGLPYPFDKYDQVFVPEMNLGAMEHPGCVTFREEYVFRSRVTDADYERRASTVLHEMAHMWFGNLVTMRWWDDLWLNESFATYAAALAQAEATRWTDAWATFADSYKAAAYRQDQLPTTHPIAADIVDIRSMEVNFDAITYQKGASVLKQLVAAIGVDGFLAGLHRYFERHAWGSTTLADLLKALEEETGRSLTDWSARWLETCGPNLLRPSYQAADGRYESFAVLQSAPAAHPTLRPHRLAIGLYDRGPAGLTRRQRIELDVTGERTEVPSLTGAARPDLLLLNDDDLTYAKVRLDPDSLRTMLAGIGDIQDPLPQAVCWTIAWDLVRDAELPARDYVALVLSGIGSVRQASIVQTLLAQARSAAQQYTDPAWRAEGLSGFADRLLALAGTAEPGGEAQLAYARTFARVARSPAQLQVVAGLLDGSAVLPGLVVDTDLRWALLRRLAACGRAGSAEIDAEARRDPTAGGQHSAAACRAAVGTGSAKAEAWQRIVSGELSTGMLRASLDGFREPDQAELLEPYAERYFTVLESVVDRWPTEITQRFAVAAYPSVVARPDTVARTDRYLASARPPGWLHRLVLEGRDELARTLRAQARDARAAMR